MSADGCARAGPVSRGFTLIEMLTVVVILGVLMAIAIRSTASMLPRRAGPMRGQR